MRDAWRVGPEDRLTVGLLRVDEGQTPQSRVSSPQPGLFCLDDAGTQIAEHHGWMQPNSDPPTRRQMSERLSRVNLAEFRDSGVRRDHSDGLTSRTRLGVPGTQPQIRNQRRQRHPGLVARQNRLHRTALTLRS